MTAAALLQQAIAHIHAGRPGDAAPLLESVLIGNPGDLQACFYLGFSRHLLLQPDAAVANFRRAAILGPTVGEAHFSAAIALGDQSRFAEAAHYLRRSAALRPDHARSYAQLGLSLNGRRRPAAAAGMLATALRLAPDLAEAHGFMAAARLALGDAAAALSHGETALRLGVKEHLPALLLTMGGALEALGRDVEALAAYERATTLNPGLGEPFTRRSLFLLRRAWGPPPAPQPAPAVDDSQRLTINELGVNGRFGNQLLQYGFLRLYAERYGLRLETPDWIGRDLFDLDDPLPGTLLPTLEESRIDLPGMLAGRLPEGCAGHNVAGYFCGETAPLAPYREEFRRFFTPRRRAAAIAAEVAQKLRARGGPVVALHLRRGDFGWGQFWISPEEWYLTWLERIWPQLNRPTLYVATDAPALIERFAAYAPLRAEDLGAPPPGAEFFIDHCALASADLLAISNSTFSFTAAMLNRNGWAFMRPDRAAGGLAPFDPWNARALLD